MLDELVRLGMAEDGEDGLIRLLVAGFVPRQGFAEMAQLIDGTSRAGVHVMTATLKPSARGRRYKNSRGGITFTDGPFTESKELIAGYVLIASESLDDAGAWAVRYLECVGADEVDLLEVESA